MKCKPGDLAIVMQQAKNANTIGKIVKVMYRAPQEPFDLPDGTPHAACGPSRWICEFQHALMVPFGKMGFKRPSFYGAVTDAVLLPIDPGVASDAIVREQGIAA